MNWNLYPSFSEAELRCKETGECDMSPAFMARLQALRTAFGAPLRINSGYRSPRHSVEAAKPEPGVHSLGRAVDIAADGRVKFRLIALAPLLGFTGIGVAKTFIHLDDWDGVPRPNVWTY
jgi:zinc D-Ala-D-Ala carboxypeptidase